jgi:hypothetical protein
MPAARIPSPGVPGTRFVAHEERSLSSVKK